MALTEGRKEALSCFNPTKVLSPSYSCLAQCLSPSYQSVQSLSKNSSPPQVTEQLNSSDKEMEPQRISDRADRPTTS